MLTWQLSTVSLTTTPPPVKSDSTSNKPLSFNILQASNMYNNKSRLPANPPQKSRNPLRGYHPPQCGHTPTKQQALGKPSHASTTSSKLQGPITISTSTKSGKIYHAGHPGQHFPSTTRQESSATARESLHTNAELYPRPTCRLSRLEFHTGRKTSPHVLVLTHKNTFGHNPEGDIMSSRWINEMRLLEPFQCCGLCFWSCTPLQMEHA